jgi:serine/threonine protein kinase
MKGRGEIIGGYRLLTDPTNDGGGKCMWAFAEKDGHHYFIKRFLEPKRPKADSGTAASRKLRLEECEEFEERHLSIMDRLAPDASGAGNLVLAVDFFHEGSTYYKVTERIDTSSLEHPERLTGREKAVLLKTLALSVEQLHKIDVVHGDLKPGNVLVQKRPGSPFHVAKLIDFDDSYISGKPPSRELVGGDTVFGAPEWRRYVQGDEDLRPEHLTTAADMFALGLIVHRYLTGDSPGHDARFPSPADAVNADEKLRIDGRLDPVMAEMIRDLTARAPGARPAIASLLGVLKEETCVLAGPSASRVKKTLKDTTPPVRVAPAAPGGRVSRVRINLSDRR